MLRSGNGIGTVHYGRSHEREDGSYVATVWVVVFYLPLWPIRSERILPLSFFDNGAGQQRMKYSILSRELLDWPKIWLTYAAGWSVLVWYVSLIWLYDFVACLIGGGAFLVLGWFAFPFLMLFLWQKLFTAPPKLVAKETTPGSDFSVYRRNDSPERKNR